MTDDTGLTPLRWAVFGMAALFLAVQTTEIGTVSGLRGDETYYIQAAHTMNESGEWLVPRYESGEERMRKPIATYWMVAGSMRLLGSGLAQARFPMVVLTLATLPFVYGLGVVLLDDRRAALLAVLVHVSSRMVYSLAHQARTEAPLAFFVVAAMYFFACLLFTEGRERRNAILAYAATAGVVLTKGAIVMPFVVLPLAAFLILCRKRLPSGRWRAILSPWGIATFLLLAAPWFVYMLTRFGSRFVQVFAADQLTDRLGSAGRLFFIESFLDYVGLFATDTLPWSAVIIVTACASLPLLRGALRGRPTQWLFLLLWFAVALAVFSCGNIVRGRYLLPVATVASLLGGAVLSRGWNDERTRRVLVWFLAVLVAGAFLMAAVCLGAALGYWVPAAGAGTCVAVTLLVAVGLAALRHGRRVIWAPVAGIAATMVGLMASINVLLEPPAPLETLRALAREHGAVRDVELQVGGFGKVEPLGTVALLATGRRAASVFGGGTLEAEVEAVRQFLAGPGTKLVVVDDELYEALPIDVRSQIRVVASRDDVDRPGLAPGIAADAPRWLAGFPRGRILTVRALLRDDRTASGGGD